MKILITTFGTRGDVQPYIALGIGLKHAGYEVALGTSEGYRPLIEAHQLQYLYLDHELLELTQAVMGDSNRPGDTLRSVRKMMGAVRKMMQHEWQVAQEFRPDLIMYHSKCLGSLHVAEKLGVTAVLSLPLPLHTPTRAFPVPFMSNVRLGKWFNHFSYRLMGLSGAMYGGTINDFRQNTLGLPRLKGMLNLAAHSDGRPVPVIYPYSPSLLPIPDDFPPDAHVTGYWFLDHAPDWQPDPALLRFLDAGTPPVYIGFGSMGGGGAQRRGRVALEALEQTGQRGLMARGWGGLNPGDVSDSVFLLDTVPHDWLFPRVAAVVHHGGAGTTAAGLRAGKPTVICPFIGDQPFWGDVVYRRGAGPKPILQLGLTTQNLAQAITLAVQDEGIQRTAAELGQQIRAEDGVARAVEVIGTLVNEPVHAR